MIATVERMVVGGRTVEIVRLKSTEAGRQALASGAPPTPRTAPDFLERRDDLVDVIVAERGTM